MCVVCYNKAYNTQGPAVREREDAGRLGGGDTGERLPHCFDDYGVDKFCDRVYTVSIINREGDMADRKYIKIGTKVVTRFGEAKVTGIELCENHSEKYGISVDKIFVTDKDRCVFDMDNGHWAYGYQVSYA